MKHNEHDAMRALSETAELRMIEHDDPLEQTQRMPVADRRYRMHEGRHMHEAARGEGHARAMVNNPVYRNQEIAAGMREPPHATAGDWPRSAIAEYMQATPDFREHSNRTLRREFRLTPLEIAQQDGFPNDK